MKWKNKIVNYNVVIDKWKVVYCDKIFNIRWCCGFFMFVWWLWVWYSNMYGFCLGYWFGMRKINIL